MSQTTPLTSYSSSINALLELGQPDELRALAQQGYAPATRPRVNSHIHLPPNFSAFETVQQAVELADSQDVDVLGISNYYDYSVYMDFTRQATERGIFPLFGIEIIALIDDLVRAGVKINDPGNPGKMYICGKGIVRFEDMTPQGRELLNVIRHSDSTRMAQMTERLSGIFAGRGLQTELDENAVKDMIVRRHGSPRETVYLQERHIAQAFQERLFETVPVERRSAQVNTLLSTTSKAAPDDAVKIQNDIRSHLMKAGKPGFVEETFVSFEQAYQLILELGGIPCYPVLADGTSPICAFEDPVEELIDNIQQRNIFCAEFIPIRNSLEVLSHYVKAMRKAGLVITAGTEHNTLELLPIEPTCVGGQPIPDELKDIFWEGACVVAAHQFLAAHGECGYVDDKGHFNSAYDSNEQHIEAFRKLGAAVIRRYQEKRSST